MSVGDRASRARARPPSRPSTRACGRRALARGRGDVHDSAPAALGHGRDGGAHQPHRRHHVQLPSRLPVLVGHVGELSPLRLAGVVDHHVELAEALGRLGDDPLGRVGVGDVERERRRLAAFGARPRRPRSPAPPRRGRRAGRRRPLRRGASRRRSPMPRLAPVTTQALPSRPRFILGLGPRSSRRSPWCRRRAPCGPGTCRRSRRSRRSARRRARPGGAA